MSKGQSDGIHNATKTSIIEVLQTVSWSNDSHPTDVVKPILNLPTNHKSWKSKGYGTGIFLNDIILNDVRKSASFCLLVS